MNTPALAAALEYCAETPRRSVAAPAAHTYSQRRREVAELSARFSDVRSMRDAYPVHVYLFMLNAAVLVRRADLESAGQMSLADLQWLAALLDELEEEQERARIACGVEAEDVERVHALASWRDVVTLEIGRRTTTHDTRVSEPGPRADLLKLAAALLIAAVVGLFVHFRVFIVFAAIAVVIYAYVLLLPRVKSTVTPSVPPSAVDLPPVLQNLSNAEMQALECAIDGELEAARMRWFDASVPSELDIDDLIK